MSKKIKDPREQSSRRISSPIAGPIERSSPKEVWRVLVERLTADHICALGFFLESLTRSLMTLASLILEALGIIGHSQGVDFLIVCLAYSAVSGLAQRELFPQLRSRH